MVEHMSFQTLIETDFLDLARKHAADGGRVVGYVGDDIPVELILAAGSLPVRLFGRANAPTPDADRLLESSFVPAIRHIAQQCLSGELDFMDAVVLPRNNDSAQRLYYYLCEVQRNGARIPRPLMFDLALIERETSRSHSRESTRLLASQLGADLSRLPAAALQVAQRRTRLADLVAALKTDDPPLGSAVQKFVRSSGQLWNESADAALVEAMATLPRSSRPRRIMLLGSEPADDRLHVAVERAGGSVVWDLTTAALDIDGGVHALTIDAIADLCCDRARRARRATLGEELARYARELRADAAIIWLIEEDEGLVWRLPRQAATLRSLGIPVMQLTRQRSPGDDTALEQIREFVSTLGAK
jgi:hypothetical protein